MTIAFQARIDGVVEQVRVSEDGVRIYDEVARHYTLHYPGLTDEVRRRLVAVAAGIIRRDARGEPQYDMDVFDADAP